MGRDLLHNEAENALQKALAYLLSESDNALDYKDAYVLLPVILRHYGRAFPFSDNTLETKLSLEKKRFCWLGDCFNDRVPGRKYLKALEQRWRSAPEHIDTRMEIATHYNALDNAPALEALLCYKDSNLYELTHAGIFLFLIREQSGPGAPGIAYWQSVLLGELNAAIAERSWMQRHPYKAVNQDVLLELFLARALLAGLQESELQELLQYQRYDGSYSVRKDGAKGSTHATLIAVWTILAYQHSLKRHDR